MPIDQRIINDRQNKSVDIERIRDKCSRYKKNIENIETACAPLGAKYDAINQLKDRLMTLEERAEIKANRFRSGLISIAVAGLEKAGKTTLLKTITGIQDLPTDTARCTAVACQINYHEGKPYFDLEFHTDETFLAQIISALVDSINEHESRLNTRFQHLVIPSTIGAIQSWPLPPANGLKSATAREILESLQLIQNNLRIIRDYLNSGEQKGKPLDELNCWVAHVESPEVKAKVMAVRNCRIYTQFTGGIPSLRWIDTPGIDDPSPRARRDALATISKDADLLVLAAQPKNQPSPTESFYSFIDNLSGLKDEIPLQERMLMFLNWNEQFDPQKKEIQRYKDCITKNLSPQIITNPTCATDHDEVEANLIQRVNQHLLAVLSDQDNRVVKILQDELRSIEAKLRTDIYDALKLHHPTDNALIGQIQVKFNPWFRDFWNKLPVELTKLLAQIENLPEVKQAEQRINDQFRQRTNEIDKCYPTKEQLVACLAMNDTPLNYSLTHHVLPYLVETVSQLSDCVQEFAPVIQLKIVELLETCGLRDLLQGEKPSDKLAFICKEIRAYAPKSIFLPAFEEVCHLTSHLQYIYRWEMRPAVEYSDMFFWQNNTATQNLETLFNKTDYKKKPNLNMELPTAKDNIDKHLEVAKSISKNSVYGIHAVIESGHCRIGKIGRDVIGNLKYRLCFGSAEDNWRDFLNFKLREVLGSSYRELENQSERIRDLKIALDALERELNN